MREPPSDCVNNFLVEFEFRNKPASDW
jgi:hypothetical protein